MCHRRNPVYKNVHPNIGGHFFTKMFIYVQYDKYIDVHFCTKMIIIVVRLSSDASLGRARTDYIKTSRRVSDDVNVHQCNEADNNVHI